MHFLIEHNRPDGTLDGVGVDLDAVVIDEIVSAHSMQPAPFKKGGAGGDWVATFERITQLLDRYTELSGKFVLRFFGSSHKLFTCPSIGRQEPSHSAHPRSSSDPTYLIAAEASTSFRREVTERPTHLVTPSSPSRRKHYDDSAAAKRPRFTSPFQSNGE